MTDQSFTEVRLMKHKYHQNKKVSINIVGKNKVSFALFSAYFVIYVIVN